VGNDLLPDVVNIRLLNYSASLFYRKCKFIFYVVIYSEYGITLAILESNAVIASFNGFESIKLYNIIPVVALR